MRVLTIAIDLNPGGAQRVARNFALGYQRRGVDSAYFGYQGGGPLEQQLLEQRVAVFVGSADEQEQRLALGRALAWRPDVVHFHRPGARDARSFMLRAIKAAPRSGTRAPVGIVETNFFGRVDYSPERSLIDVHYLISRWCLWKWQRWARVVSPRPIGVLLPNLVMHTEFAPRPATVREQFRRTHGIPADALVFGRIGSPIISKWSPTIFSAFAQYAADNAKAWLLLVGLPVELHPIVEALPVDIRPRVLRLEFMADDALVIDAYGAMDVFLHAARIGESFGMVLAEALLCGVPVITLGTPDKDNGQMEIVGHESGGLVVADVKAMVAAMQQLEDAQLRHRYAEQGAAEIVRRFSADALMPAAIDVAQLVAAGLAPEQLRRQLLARPQLCTQASNEEIRTLLRRCIGRYDARSIALMKLVGDPYLYRLYCMATAKVI
ncbi:MAG: glycosyltransferase family 4 protein [Steroidobacteraceae bacterium]